MKISYSGTGMSSQHLAAQAGPCVMWLRAQELDVLRVEQGPGLPRITIRHSTLCDRFEGAVACYSRTVQAEQRYKMAMRFGCEVRWADNGGAA